MGSDLSRSDGAAVPGNGPKVLGLDIGGTHSRARLVAGDVVVAEALAPSASVAAQGEDAALAALDSLLAQLPLEAWLPLDCVCAGAAGLISEPTIDKFDRRLAKLTADGLVLLVGDGFLVLPAAGLTDGVGVICGTGAVAFGQAGGRISRAGGWGYLLGDDGSGYWVVKQAIRELLDRAERGRPPGPLTAELLAAAGATNVVALRDDVYADPRPGKWAAFAPLVLSSDDPASATIIAQVADALLLLVDAAVEGLGSPPDLPVVLAGGLTGHPRFQDDVVGRLRLARPGSPVSILQVAPVAGAVRLAQMACEGPVLGGARRIR